MDIPSLVPLDQLSDQHRPHVGSKAWTLRRLGVAGLRVPHGAVVPAGAYRRFVAHAGLHAAIAAELARKPLEAMRWEELWDAALRIRGAFLRTPMPADLAAALGQWLPAVGDAPLAVRSSALDEDSGAASFAGLHDSVIGVRGPAECLEAVRRVWASLWSDRALLYRRELRLDPRASAMAVLVQPLILGRAAGVCFGQAPDNPAHGLVEAVRGLNAGLVDGAVDPDRYTLDAASGRLLRHVPPAERRRAELRGQEVRIVADDGPPPLTPAQAQEVYALCRRAGELLAGPQDMEWLLPDQPAEDGPVILQSRPLSAAAPAGDASAKPWDRDDKRPWYLSLTRSFENLTRLRATVECELLPAMDAAAQGFGRENLADMNADALADAVEARAAAFRGFRDAYWAQCIPLAHGARLFGQAYNDALRPNDPYEFLGLLSGQGLGGLRRNGLLEAMADMARQDPALRARLAAGQGGDLPPAFARLLAGFREAFGDLACNRAWCGQGEEGLLAMVARMAEAPPHKTTPVDPAALEARYLTAFAESRRGFAAELLDLARASYRLRDDDNLHLGRVEARLLEAMAQARALLAARGQWGADAAADPARIAPEEVAALLRDPARQPPPRPGLAEAPPQPAADGPARLAGQPAGPGVAVGRARVVRTPQDLYALQPGEVLVCDSLDPAMTFVAPLAAAIVERRGGMLVHGAIIAREYGIPCVTGVERATEVLRDGDELTVDGYRGTVTVRRLDVGTRG